MNTIEIPWKKYQETGITIVGSSNIDLFLYMDEFPQDGETIHANSLVRWPGGKGSNQAACVAKLSSPKAYNIFLGCVGDGAGGVRISSNYKDLGFKDVDKHVTVIPNCRSGHASISVNQRGMNRIILDYGANKHVKKSQFDQSFEEIKSKTKILITQFELNMDIVEYSLQKAKEAGLMTILNPAPAKKNISPDLYKNSDIFIPNETETEVLLDCKCTNIEEAKEAAILFQKEKGANDIIITLGEMGCVVLRKGDSEPVHVKVPIKVKPVDTTGAGDAFVGSLAYFLSCGEDYLKSVEYACYIASLSVAVGGKGCQGSYPTRDELMT